MAIWNQLIRHRWFENIEKVAWRRLITKRSKDFYPNMTDFITDNLNKKFGFTLTKLFKFQPFIYYIYKLDTYLR